MNHDEIKAFQPLPAGPGESDGGDRAIRFGDLVGVVRRHLLLLFVCIALALAAAAYYVATATPKYVGSAEMLLGNTGSNTQTSRDLLDERALNDSAVQGEIAVLKSTALLVRVVRRLRLQDDPEFNPALRPPVAPNPVVDRAKAVVRAILAPLTETTAPAAGTGSGESAAQDGVDAIEAAARAGDDMVDGLGRTVGLLRRSLQIQQRGTSFVVSVTATSDSPVTAAAIANAVVDEYIAFTSDRRFEAALRYTGWLEDRVTELARTVEESESAVLGYRARIESEVDSSDRLAQQMEEMTTKLVNVRADLSETEARVAEARDLEAREGIVASARLLSSPALDELNRRLGELRRERDEAARRFGERSPRRAAIATEIEVLDTELRLEVERAIAELETRARVQSINLDALRRSLAQLESRAVDRSREEIQLNQLARVADANRRLYEDFLGRFKQSSEIQNLRQSDAEVISFASPPGQPATPRAKPALALAAAGGLLAGLGLALLLEMRPKRLSTSEQVAATTGLRVFGHLPRLPALSRPRSLGRRLSRNAALAETGRTIRRNLDLALGRPLRSALVVGADGGGDKTVTAILLGRALAEDGKHCLLVDADVRGNHLSVRLAAETRPGLLELLYGEAKLEDVVSYDSNLDLWVLPCRPSGLDPATLFSTPQAEALLKEMVGAYDAVVIDAPPLNAMSDVVAFGTPVDASLYVVPAGDAPTRATADRMPLLRMVRAELEGAIITRLTKVARRR